MSKVIDLWERLGKVATEMICEWCAHYWIAVHDYTLAWLECPACGKLAEVQRRPPRDD